MAAEKLKAVGSKATLLLQPAIWALNRMTYWQKFLLIGVLMLLPFLIVTLLGISVYQRQVEFGRREQVGMKYLQPLSKLMLKVPEVAFYKSLDAVGETMYANQWSRNLDKMQASRGAAQNMQNKHGETLQTGAAWHTFDKAFDAWEASMRSSQTSLQDMAGKTEKLLAELQDLILEAANNSELVHDPASDSYWLMDAYTRVLPELTKASTMAAFTCIEARQQGRLDEFDRRLLAGYWARVKRQIDVLVNTNMRFAAQAMEQGELKTTLKKQADNAAQHGRRFLAFMDKQLRSPDDVDFGAEDIRNNVFHGLLAHSRKFLSEDVPQQLGALISARVSEHQSKTWWSWVMAVVAALAVTYIFLGFYFGVRQSIGNLDRATRRMIAGTKEHFSLKTHDELAQIASLYNEINRELVKARDMRQSLQDHILALLDVVSRAADGDLTVRAEVTEDELGNVADALNQMLESWQELVSEIKRLADSTEGGVMNIGKASAQLASGATRQFEQLGDASRAVENMRRGIEYISANAEKASEAATRTQDAAQRGADSVQNVIAGMNTLRANVQAGAKKIKSLGDRSMDITSFASTIASISEETKMLALNAAIEAARAGEHGRGFSVVAQEVRDLARSTAEATREIQKLVLTIQNETTESVAAFEEQTQIVEGEAQVVSRTGEALSSIQNVSTESAQEISQISSISKQHVQDSAKMTEFMSHVSEIARQAEEGARHTLQITRDLGTLSEQLTRSIGKFRLQTGNGRANAPAASSGAVASHEQNERELAGAGV